MRTIYVTGNRKDYAELTLTESSGLDLAAATIRLGLSTSNTVPPTEWYVPDKATCPQAGTAVLALLIDADRAPVGSWFLWADVIDNPTSQPVVAAGSQLRTL